MQSFMPLASIVQYLFGWRGREGNNGNVVLGGALARIALVASNPSITGI